MLVPYPEDHLDALKAFLENDSYQLKPGPVESGSQPPMPISHGPKKRSILVRLIEFVGNVLNAMFDW